MIPAATDKVVTVWTAQAANTSTTVLTDGYQTAQVTIWAKSGSPDGTAKVYLVPPNGAPLVLLATYATPTTAKTFRGPAGTSLVVDIRLLDDGLETVLREWLDYGALRGLGQWRNSGKGRFTWEEIA